MIETSVRNLPSHDRVEAYYRIESLYKARRSRRSIPEYLATSKGMFAASPAHEVFELFTQMELSRYGSFCDLGSGDGMVTHLASLFTTAHGLEHDPGLVAIAQDAGRELGLEGRASFTACDYLDADLCSFEVLYIYPDSPLLYGLESRLGESFEGILVVYGPHFQPGKMAKLHEYQLGQGRAVVYAPAKL